MSWLKSISVNASAPKYGVLDLLRKSMGGYRPARSHKTVHASDITKDGFCPRRLALMDKLEVDQKPEYISTALAATFDIGTMTAKLVVENWLTPYAIGNWKCLKCDSQRTMCSKPESSCKCGGKCIWEYVEPNFVSAEYGVSGSLDVLVEVGSKWLVVELKIIRPEDFETMLVPLPEHRIRTSLYLKLVSDSGSPWVNHINLHEARVLYVSRGYGKQHPVHKEILPFREFVVERDDKLLEKPLILAKQVQIYKKSGKLPSGVCKTAVDKRAKYCEVCAQCFSGKYASEQDVLP